MRLTGNRPTTEGELAIEAKRFRTQEINRQDAIIRLVVLTCRAADKPKATYRDQADHGVTAAQAGIQRQQGETRWAREGSKKTRLLPEYPRRP